MTKYRVGDIVQVNAVVKRINFDKLLLVPKGHKSFSLIPKSSVSMKLKKIHIGETIYCSDVEEEGVVIAVHGEWVWFECKDGSPYSVLANECELLESKK